MNLGAFLKKVGVDLEKIGGEAAEAAEVAEPVVDILFPEIATVYNGAVNESVKLLSAGQQAASQGGSTTVEFSNVAAAVAPALVAYAQSLGLPAPTAAHIDAYTQAMLNSLQVLTSIESGTAAPVVAATVTLPAPVAAVAVHAPSAAA